MYFKVNTQPKVCQPVNFLFQQHPNLLFFTGVTENTLIFINYLLIYIVKEIFLRTDAFIEITTRET